MVANVTITDQVATVRLSSPNGMGTISLNEFGELRDIFKSLNDNDEVRAIIVTGEGRAFCAGLSLDGFLDDGGTKLTSEHIRRSFDEDLNPLLRLMMGLNKPIITAINGTVAGGGMGLALAGDIVIASDEAKFYCGFIKMLAIVPDVGTCWLLPNLMGRNKALPFALLGDGINARQASDAGMIYHTVAADALMDEARLYADRLMKAPAEALRRARKLFTDAGSMTYSDMLDQERDTNSVLAIRPEMAEGVTAFLEKREPDFAAVAGKPGSCDTS